MKLFVWDFHGTLEQGNELAVLEMSNAVLEMHGYEERFSTIQCQYLYGKRWHEYFEHLLPQEQHEKHIELQEDCFKYSLNHPEIILKYIKPVEGALQVLETIAATHDQILISNTRPEALTVFMEAIGVNHLFPLGKAHATNADSHKMTKVDVLKRYLQNKDFEEVVTIGDSPGDIELGQAVGAKTILYTHPGLEFKECAPHHKINNLLEVLEHI